MSYLLHSTAIIDFPNGRPGGVRLIRDPLARTSELYTCEVVTYETLSGGTREGREIVRRLARRPGSRGCRSGGSTVGRRVRAERAAGGSRRHLGDAFMAGLAWRLGATIVTPNPGDFEAYGVPVLGYETD